jgi:hypothetical protein
LHQRPTLVEKAYQEVTEMSVSPAVLTSTTAPVDEHATQPATVAPSVGPSAGVESTEVLITTQEVLFGTAAARGLDRDHTGRRFGATLRRFFALSRDASRPPRHEARRYAFLENALMSREMDRL